MSARYAKLSAADVNPLSISGANVPGFPVEEDISTQSAALAETHTFGASTLHSLRAGFFRNVSNTNNPINRTSPQQLGFNYGSTLAAAEGPPFFIVSGYASVGNPITGPRVTTQNTYEVQDSLFHNTGRHSLKVGVEFRRNQINMAQGIAQMDSSSLLRSRSVTLLAAFWLDFPSYSLGGGDFNRGLRNCDFAVYGRTNGA